MIVETAVGQAGGAHQLGDADIRKAAPLEEAERGVDDFRPVFGGLFPGEAHALFLGLP